MVNYIKGKPLWFWGTILITILLFFIKTEDSIFLYPVKFMIELLVYPGGFFRNLFMLFLVSIVFGTYYYCIYLVFLQIVKDIKNIIFKNRKIKK